MLNSINLLGRLTRDPELRYTTNNIEVCTVTIAVDRDYVQTGAERECDFIDIVCWRNTGIFVAKHFTKGQLIAVSGRLQTRKWRDKFDQNRVSVEVVADQVYFAGRKEPGAEKPGARNTDAEELTPWERRDTTQAEAQNTKPASPDIFPEPDYEQETLPRSAYAYMDEDDDTPY